MSTSLFPRPTARLPTTAHKASASLQLRGLRNIPHSIVFAFVNLAYCVPVLLAYALKYGEGGVAETLDISPGDVWTFAMVYASSICAFHLGAWLIWRIPLRRGTARTAADYAQKLPFGGIKIAVLLVSGALLISKIALIPQGVYAGYAFDENLMTGGIWTFSMFLSETLIILVFAVLIVKRSLKSPWFILGFVCICSNLLHGTRIFTIATLLGLLIYFWITREITRKMLWYGAIGILASGIGVFIAFALRQDYHYSDDANGLTIALSPIIYEAVFSQISLIRYLQSYTPTAIGHPVGFIIDAISFITPRILNPDKDIGGVISEYDDLSLLGAFSGHAAGLIYFGFCLPVFYFLLGAFGSWLQRKAKSQPTFFIIYLYFTGDILFRLMRDGYIYPLKYFVDSVIVILLALTAGRWLTASRPVCRNHLFRRSRDIPVARR